MARYKGPDSFETTYVEHVPGSPEVTLERERSGAQRILDCNWGDAPKFAKSLLGYPGGIQFYGSNRYIRRYPPHEYPERLLFTQTGGGASLRATRVSIRGLGQPSYSDDFTGEETFRVATYPTARLTVSYSTLPYDVWTDQSLETLFQGSEASLCRYVSKVVAPAGQYLTLPGDSFKFVAYDGFDLPPVGLGGRPVMMGTGKMIVHHHVSLTWFDVPEAFVPCCLVRPAILQAAGGPQAIDNALGKVNNATFAGYPAGTLLLSGVAFRPAVSPFGQRCYDITYAIKRFQPESGKGHNHIFKQFGGVGRWYETTTNGTTNLVAQTDGKSVYDWADFDGLFTPAPLPALS